MLNTVILLSRCYRCDNMAIEPLFSKNKKTGKKSNICIICEDMMYKCDICGMICSTNGSLKRHNDAVHLKKKKFKCVECGIILSTNGSLTRHNNVIHLKKKKFQCVKCDVYINRLDNFRKHVRRCENILNI